MPLNEKERTTLTDLQTQEKTCVEKYHRYGEEAKDPVLKELFQTIEKSEQQHVQALAQALLGNTPECDCNDDSGKKYCPQATYEKNNESKDKASDCFLATDCITSEKLTSSEYNSNVFNFGDSAIRKLLADIQIEEQNHAEMLYKYKTVNGMA